MSKKLNSWSKTAHESYDSIMKLPKKVIGVNGKKVAELSKLFPSNGEIVKYSNTTGYRASQYVRAILHMFGLEMDKTDDVAKVGTKSEKELKSLLSQVSPIIPYVSKRFLEKLSTSLNNVESKSSTKEMDTIVKIAAKGKLTDYLMKFVTDNQLTKRTSTVVSEANEFLKNKTVKHCKKSLARKSAADSNDCGKSDNETATDDSDSMKLISALKVENQRMRKQIERTYVSGGNDQLLIERIEDAIRSMGNSMQFTKKPWNGGSTFKKNEHGTAVLHISDWHIGSKENVNGFNTFDYGVACERVKMLANKYIDWTKMHRSLYNIDELVIIATGDMISGDIHDELIRTNEFSVPEQCIRASTLLAKLTNELSGFFKKIRVEYIVADNHSRTTAKIEFGDGTNSYNYIVGYMSKLMLGSNKSVEFNLYPEIQRVIKVENLKYLITHGNCVRGGFAGIPFYSMQRKVGAEASIRMNMPQDYHFDKIVMGHYHVPMRSTQYEMTGCLSSTTMFDHSAGRHCRACQTAWIVSKDNELDYFEIWLS